MISKAMIKFRSKFQFQIPLQFYRTVEEVEHFDYYFVFSGLRFKHSEYKGTSPKNI